MNATVFQKGDYFILAVGGERGLCVLYKIKFKIDDDDELIENKENRQPAHVNGLIRRRMSSGSVKGASVADRERAEPDSDNLEKQINLTFEITKITEFKADFFKYEGKSEVKAVKYSPSAKLLVTGGTDGSIRLFGYPDLRLVSTLPAHEREITGLAIDVTGYRVVSISDDRKAFVWNIKERSKLKELKLNLNNTVNGKLVEYDFRDCQFGVAPNSPKQTAVLYTVHNPRPGIKPACKSLICKWNTRSFEIERLVYTGLESISRLTVSEDGRYLGVGLLSSGNIEMYDASTLAKIYTSNRSHSIFVTAIEFLNSSFESRMLAGDHEASLLSVSVDNQIRIHHLSRPDDQIGYLGSSFLFIFTLFLIYLFFGILGL